jgi:Bacterial extracellular solute-binding protein
MNAFRVATLILICLFRSDSLFSQDLVTKARDEKKLVLYHSTGIEDTQQILDRFRKRYPFLQVENHRVASVKMIQRITTEIRAGRDLADAYIISGLQTWLLKDMGYLATYNSPERAKIRPALRDRQGYWTGVLWNLGVLGYNTNMVPPGAVPRAWQDLLQPRWKAQIGLEAEDVSWYIFILHLMGPEKGKAFFQQLSRQQPQVRSGHNLIAQLLTGGNSHWRQRHGSIGSRTQSDRERRLTGWQSSLSRLNRLYASVSPKTLLGRTPESCLSISYFRPKPKKSFTS